MLSRILVVALGLAIIILVLGLAIKKRINNTDYFADLGAKIAGPNQGGGLLQDRPNHTIPRIALESDTPLPEKVREAFKNTISIRTQFVLNQPGLFSPREPIESGGTGFMVEPGLILSARHIFLVTITDLDKRGYQFKMSNGLPQSDYYTYNFYGTSFNKNALSDFPIELVGMGDIKMFQDFAAFKISDAMTDLKSLEFEEKVSLGETVYSSGRVPLFVWLENMGFMRNKGVLMDFISYTFSGRISAILVDMPINKELGIKKIYRLNSSLESGFSGGPLLNKEGKAVGLNISKIVNFTYAISAEDLKLFREKLRKEGRIK